MAGKRNPRAKIDRFSIAREGMDKINAVEGVKRSAASRRMFIAFDRGNLTFEDRLRVLMAAHAKKA